MGPVNRLSRRSVLAGGLAVAGLAACSAKTRPGRPVEPVPPVHDRIEALQRRYNVKIGVYAVDLQTGRTVSHLDGELVRHVFDVQGLRGRPGAADGAERRS